jgi:hypothetical protein
VLTAGKSLAIVVIVLLNPAHMFAHCGQASVRFPQRDDYLKQVLFHPDRTQSPNAVFELYSETSNPDGNQHFVLYSIKVPGITPSSDANFSVFLAY